MVAIVLLLSWKTKYVIVVQYPRLGSDFTSIYPLNWHPTDKMRAQGKFNFQMLFDPLLSDISEYIEIILDWIMVI